MFNINRLKELRLAAGESQAMVASVLNITQQAYANYESGKRKPDIMVISKLAKHYDVMINSFFADEETKKPASVSADGWQDDVRSLKPELLAALADFVALAKGDQETALRYLSFANQELRSRQ